MAYTTDEIIEPFWAEYSKERSGRDPLAIQNSSVVIYAKLYGLTTEELRYILDPQDVYGPDFPGETFRVLKDKEIRKYGEYRTRRLVLEAWKRLERG